MKKIALCLPSGDLVHTDFAISLFGLKLVNSHEITLINIRTSIIEMSRHALVKEALKREAEYVFFIDSDISFPDYALDQLLHHDKEIVCATYVRRRAPRKILGYAFDDQEIEPGQTGLVPMARLPLGFSLIKSSVFSKLEQPWFDTVYDPVKEEWHSEDYEFCDRARAIGYTVFCDLDLSHALFHTGSEAWHWGYGENS